VSQIHNMSGLGAYSRHRGTEIDLQMVFSGVVLFEPCLTDYAEPFDLQVSLLGVISSMNPGRLDAAVPTASATISATCTVFIPSGRPILKRIPIQQPDGTGPPSTTKPASVRYVDAQAQHCAGLTDAINPASRHV